MDLENIANEYFGNLTNEKSLEDDSADESTVKQNPFNRGGSGPGGIKRRSKYTKHIKTRFAQYSHTFEERNTHCLDCIYNNGRLFEASDLLIPPVRGDNHPLCHCKYVEVPEMGVGGISKMGFNAPDVWLKAYGVLPDYYITKEEAKEKYGWNPEKNTVSGKASGKMIGGDIYYNKDERLPAEKGRIWYECDVDYESGKRSGRRLFYSNDGLMFYSRDHGEEDFIFIY